MKYFLKSLCVLAVCCVASNASAQLTALCDAANPCSVQGELTPGVSSEVNLLWRGRANVERGGDIISDAARFLTPDNLVLGVAELPLRQRLAPNAIGAPVSFTINERLSVPAAIVQRAISMGAQEIIFVRTFSYERWSLSARQRIRIKPLSPNSSNSLPAGSEPDVSALGITRISLRFDTGKQTEMIESGKTLRAIATVNFERAGLLDAVWEVATPASTGGQAIYRQLENVRQYLAASRQVAIQSPPLPNDLAGIYRVRLRLIRPALEQAPIELRYQVNEAPSRLDQAPIQLSKVSPQAGAAIKPEAEFSWPDVAGARAWQLEIYAQPNDAKPLAGLLLRGEQTSSPLSTSVLTQLIAGRMYYWRVIAMDEKGAVIAVSELREIRVRE